MDELKMLTARPLNRRTVAAGFAGLGAVALVGTRMASAQTPTTDDDDNTGTIDQTTMDPDIEAKLVALYEIFLTSVSGELGVADTASLDLAIRNGLKAVIDRRLADGEISADWADERKAAIDAAAVPIRIGGWGSGEHRRDGHGDRPWDDDEDDTEDDEGDD